MNFLAHRRFTSWIAIIAILLNTLAPAIAHALAGQGGLARIEICTPHGLEVRVAPPGFDQGRPAPTPHVVAFDHCPYCAPHGASFAAPPVATPSIAAVDGVRYAAPAAEVTRLAGTNPNAALARGPPRLA